MGLVVDDQIDNLRYYYSVLVGAVVVVEEGMNGVVEGIPMAGLGDDGGARKLWLLWWW